MQKKKEKKLLEKRQLNEPNMYCTYSYSDSGENCIKLQLLMQLAQEQVQSPKV